MIRVRGYRHALHYATRQIRALGRELVAGDYSKEAHPMTAPHAFLVMSKAFIVVTEYGLTTVFDALDQSLQDLLGGLTDGGR